MTVAELKTLTPDDRLLWESPFACEPPLVGRVAEADYFHALVHWLDGTASTLWVRHCESGRDRRHEAMTVSGRFPPAGTAGAGANANGKAVRA